MDSNLPQSKSVPNLAASRRHRVSISGSGSYQSHLSSIGHHHRIRTTSEQVSLNFVYPEKNNLQLEDGLTEQRPRVGRLCLLKQFTTDSATCLSDDLRRIRSGHVWRLRTLLTLYYCLSILFLTIKIYILFQGALQRHPGSKPAQGTSLTSLTNVSLSQRLSVAFRGLSPQAHLDPFVVQAHPDHESDLTICLWIEDTDIEEARVSAAEWTGHMSLLVVTTHTPGSIAYKNMLGNLTTFANTSVHVLHVPTVAGASTNTYLNMARFFAHTERVILFPGGLSKLALATRQMRWRDTFPVDTPHPVLLSNTTHSAFLPRALTPVMLPRDHPVWCTERWYLFGSRVLDWDDCLWTLWLESAGEASSIAVPLSLDGSMNATAVSPFAMKMRLRWSTRYRSEACAFTLKRSQALESLSKTEKRHMQWKRRFCRETVGPGALEVP